MSFSTEFARWGLALLAAGAVVGTGLIAGVTPAIAGTGCASTIYAADNLRVHTSAECDLPLPSDFRLRLTLVHPDGLRETLVNGRPTRFQSDVPPFVYRADHFPACGGTFVLEHREYRSGALVLSVDQYAYLPSYWFPRCFEDTGDSRFRADIYWAATDGITVGCTATTFCPNGLVTRGQMATFISRALNLPATNVDYFTDDESNKHEANINRLRHADITFGCGGTKFCPDGVVTRGQMASFLVRAFDLPATSTNYFSDDNGTAHEANINRLRAANITSGCGGTKFCPNGSVTRGQMAAFLHRAIE